MEKFGWFLLTTVVSAAIAYLAAKLTKRSEFKEIKKNVAEVSRLTKQGEYEAMKKDIAAVTRQVKTAENNLNVLMQNEISFSTEVRNSIVQYTKALIQIMTELAPANNLKSRKKIRENVHRIFGEFMIAQSQLLLFVKDNEINGNISPTVEVVCAELNECMNDIENIDDDQLLYEKLTAKYQVIHSNRAKLINLFRIVLKSQYIRLDEPGTMSTP